LIGDGYWSPMNLVRLAWNTPWNELRLAEQLVNG